MAKACWVLHRLWERLFPLWWHNHLFCRLRGGGAHGDEEESVLAAADRGDPRRRGGEGSPRSKAAETSRGQESGAECTGREN